MRNRKLPTFSSQELLHEAFTIATAFGRTIYDALYVALAVGFKAQLVTADERLANSLAAYLPVKWLGRFKLPALSRFPHASRYWMPCPARAGTPSHLRRAAAGDHEVAVVAKLAVPFDDAIVIPIG